LVLFAAVAVAGPFGADFEGRLVYWLPAKDDRGRDGVTA
jgi:hypothetical protein